MLKIFLSQNFLIKKKIAIFLEENFNLRWLSFQKKNFLLKNSHLKKYFECITNGKLKDYSR